MKQSEKWLIRQREQRDVMIMIENNCISLLYRRGVVARDQELLNSFEW